MGWKINLFCFVFFPIVTVILLRHQIVGKDEGQQRNIPALCSLHRTPGESFFVPWALLQRLSTLPPLLGQHHTPYKCSPCPPMGTRCSKCPVWLHPSPAGTSQRTHGGCPQV